MPRYVAFLRAINVGGHTVKMDQLRRLFERLGFSKVETFIASGNVIFESASRSAKALEKNTEAHRKRPSVTGSPLSYDRSPNWRKSPATNPSVAMR